MISQKKLFGHIIQFRNRQNYAEKELTVSEYLNAKVSSNQQRLLNPAVLDTITGLIIKDIQGEGARKRLAQQRLNFVDGTVSSHCQVLNSAERNLLIRQANKVAAMMANLRNQKLKEKEKKRQDKEFQEAARKEKRENKIAAEKEKAKKAFESNKKLLRESKRKDWTM